MEDQLAMKYTARSADLRRQLRGPVRTKLAMKKAKLPLREIDRCCLECDLWWFFELQADIARHLKASKRPIIEGDYQSNFGRYMHRRLAHDISQMSPARYREWSSSTTRCRLCESSPQRECQGSRICFKC